MTLSGLSPAIPNARQLTHSKVRFAVTQADRIQED
jgi:hypothetical protein